MSKARMARCVIWAAIAVTPLGCQPGLGWLATVMSPAEKVKPLYTLPPGKTVLVFADDLLNPVPYQPVKLELTERLNALLAQKKLVADTVPYEEIVMWASRTEDLEQLSVAEVGRALGADVVLYVHIDRLRLKEDASSSLWRGEMATTVRVVDVRAGRLWPLDRPEGYVVPAVDTGAVDDPSPVYGAEVARQLAEAMAENIIKLFCKHTIPATTPPPPPRERI